MSELTGAAGGDLAPGEPEPKMTPESVALGLNEKKYVLGPDGQPLIGSDGKPIIDRRRPKSERRPSNPRVSVVVPAKNEAPNIREILPYLGQYHEVIVVVSEDDHESAEAARAALPSAKVIHQTRKGKGNAMADRKSVV